MTAIRRPKLWVPSGRASGASGSQQLSPRKLHPVLRAERAEEDRFTTGQKNNFFSMFDESDFRRSEINCFLSVVQLCVPQCDVFYISPAF